MCGGGRWELGAARSVNREVYLYSDFLFGLLSTFGDRVLEIILELSSHVAQLGDRTQDHQKRTRTFICREDT